MKRLPTRIERRRESRWSSLAVLGVFLAMSGSAMAGKGPASVLEELISIHRNASMEPVPSHPARASGGMNKVALDRPPAIPAFPLAVSNEARECPALLRYSFTPLQGGAAQSLCQYRGKVVVVVNTASDCGYTPQYEGLEALHRKYREHGLVVVGFPSNDFGGQEPGTNKQIAEFCRTAYGVQFPMFEKPTGAKLADNPLYSQLASITGKVPRWNFHKYVIDRTGQRVRSFDSAIEPQSRELVRLLDQWLSDKAPLSREKSG